MKNVLQSLPPEEKGKIVLRCDDLPLVKGDEATLENLFQGLLQMILQKKEEVQTLFLHISCTADEKTPMEKAGTRFFTTQFNTNIIPCTAWFERNKGRLDELSAMVAQSNGSLAVNQFRSSGCIFSVSLPGKAV
ncbi:MAG TPA: hypothetical protein VGN63_09885 [Flavisolibacter sp.]|nr:hypothetical protein [Flavisolibacter sp.]